MTDSSQPTEGAQVVIGGSIYEWRRVDLEMCWVSVGGELSSEEELLTRIARLTASLQEARETLTQLRHAYAPVRMDNGDLAVTENGRLAIHQPDNRVVPAWLRALAFLEAVPE